MRKIIALAFFFFSVSLVSAQSVKDLYLLSMKAHRYKNRESFLFFAKQVDSIRPSHPQYTYNLAAAYALNGKPQPALRLLEKCILMDNHTEFEKDSDFISLRSMPDYERLAKLKTELEKPVVTSLQVTALEEKDLHPEGLLYLQKSKTWLATSIRKGKIISFDIRSGKCTDWLKADHILSVFAMKADAQEKFLWIATSAVPQLKGYLTEMAGGGEVLKVDIKSKKIVDRFPLPGKHVFGDLAVAKDGTVYISDSLDATVYKISEGKLSLWMSLGDRQYNLQGLVFNADETEMYLADYFSGILEIPMNDTSKKHWLDFPDGSVKKGIDGLSWYKNTLIAVQNGVNPIRIVRYFLDEKGGQISGFKVIDNNRPEFNEPASGCISKDRFYFFANGPWNAYDKSNNLDDSKFENPKLFSFGLK